MPQLSEAYVDIVGRDMSLKSALDRAHADVNTGASKMEARLKRMSDNMVRVGKSMSMHLTAPIVAAVGVSLKAWGVQEDALIALQAALDASGSAASGAVEGFADFAAEIQKVTIYADELLLSEMAFGHNLGISAGQLKLATKAAVGLAAKYRLDLHTAMMLIGRASKGQTQMLTRYGIALDETLTPQQKFNKLLEIGAGSFKLAEDRAKSTSGQLLQLKNQIGDLAEEFGRALVPALKTLVNNMKHVVGMVQSLTQEQRKTILTIGLIVAAVGPLLIVLNQVAIAIKSVGLALIYVAGNPYTLALAAIVGLTAAIWLSVEAHKALEKAQERRYKGSPKANTADMDELVKRARFLEDRIKDAEKKQRQWQTAANVPILGKLGHFDELAAAMEARRLDAQRELSDINAAIAALKAKGQAAEKAARTQADADEKAAIAAIKLDMAKRGVSTLQALGIEKQAAVAAAETPGLKAAVAADYDDRIARERLRIQKDLHEKLAAAEAKSALERQKIQEDQQRKLAEQQKSAWQSVVDMTEDYTVKLVRLAEGETAAKMKALDVEATKRRDLIYANVKDEERRAMLMKALDADIGAQKADIMDEEAKKAEEEARADAQRRRDKIGFVGSLSDVWRSAMTAGARLGIPTAPETKTERYSKDQLDELKKIAEWSEKQYLLAQSNINKLATAESML